MFTRINCFQSLKHRMSSEMSVSTQQHASKSNEKNKRNRYRSRNQHQPSRSNNFPNKWPSNKHCVVNFLHPKCNLVDVDKLTEGIGTVKERMIIPYKAQFLTKVQMGSSSEAEKVWQKYNKNLPPDIISVTPDQSYMLSPRGPKQNTPQRKNKLLYDEYMSKDDVDKGIANGEIVTGALRVNSKKYTHAFISYETGKDILIDGLRDRNRAFDGDIVAIKIKEKSDWVQESNFEKRVETAASKVENMSMEENKPFQESSILSDSSLSGTRMTGVVVAILEQKNHRTAVGVIKVDEAKKLKYEFATFSPRSNAFPRVYVSMSSLTDVISKQDCEKILFAVKVTGWPATSKLPLGELCEAVGQSGDIKAETKRILIDNDIDHEEFSEEVLACLPKNLPWTIPGEEKQKRRDFTNECIFTIDPATARDLDDALHCKRLSDGNFEVGVHIADVSYFVKSATALDKIASQRCTSVYLVQQVIPMLPHLLCEELCSLNPGTERLAFSVVWKLARNGRILSEWMGRSVIKSCTKFSYDHAQTMIENPDYDYDDSEQSSDGKFPAIDGRFSLNEIKEKILDLFVISQSLRKQRFDNGALRLDQVKLSYMLDAETGFPSGCFAFERKSSNELIEEFMLLANMAVAHKIYKAVPTHAFLRSHPEPKEMMMDDVVNHCNSIGLDLDASSSGNLARTIQSCCGNDALATLRQQALFFLAIKPQQLAIYLCSGMESDESKYRHYALNAPLYTHFTSPIRRYADVIVHRQLAYVLEDINKREEMLLPAEELQTQAELCNQRKYNSKVAQELSIELFFNLLVNKYGPLEGKGMVIYVYDHSFDLLSVEYGVKRRVYVDSIPGTQYKLEEGPVTGKNLKVNVLKIKWLKNCPDNAPAAEDNSYDESVEGVEQVIEVFSVVDIILQKQEPETVNSIKVTLKSPLLEEENELKMVGES
ncbi:DIS3-like exonuclease 2 [Clavelina lepadiformis]|uniref:DIS3-like exonuclease 2 n=1 Tax=Clavelina lepadiformis TaxID=159417 RepID=A0ABP0H0D8_CLALP